MSDSNYESFEVGDVVECIDDTFSDVSNNYKPFCSNQLKRGQQYTVYSVEKTGDKHDWIIITAKGYALRGSPTREQYRSTRFKKIAQGTPIPDITQFLNTSLERVTLEAPPPQRSEGAKFDSEKPDMSLLSSEAMVQIAAVMTYGKKKYSAHNWRKGLAWSRLLAACLRHIFSFLKGEDKDPETGLSHLAHASCCLMMLLEFEVTHKQLDDRHKAS